MREMNSELRKRSHYRNVETGIKKQKTVILIESCSIEKPGKVICEPSCSSATLQQTQNHLINSGISRGGKVMEIEKKAQVFVQKEANEKKTRMNCKTRHTHTNSTSLKKLLLMKLEILILLIQQTHTFVHSLHPLFNFYTLFRLW